MKKRRLNIDDLTMPLRTNNIFSVLDVDYPILEPNGDLRGLKKKEVEFVTKQDISIPPGATRYIPSEITADGKTLLKNLIELGKSESWLAEKL